MAAKISLEQIERRFAGAQEPAVSELNLSVEAGKTLCLVGPSGCGKSTTLRMIAGLEQPDRGRIYIGDQDVTALPPQARNLAMVFQGFALYPHLTARKIIEFPLKMRGATKAERESRVNETAKFLNITHLLDRKPEQLSGGERQRVAMGRALVRRPEVFLFDEPLSNLDAALRNQLRVELGKLLSSLETTSVYVTHDQAEAMTLGDQIGVMRAGRLEQLGSPREIYEAPKSRFVATFFGSPSMAIIPLELKQKQLFWGETALPFAGDSALDLGLRAEQVSLNPEAPHDFTLQAKVVSRELLGAEAHLELIRIDFNADTEQPLKAKVAGFDAPGLGEVVRLYINLRHAYFFDSASGAATPSPARLASLAE